MQTGWLGEAASKEALALVTVAHYDMARIYKDAVIRGAVFFRFGFEALLC